MCLYWKHTVESNGRLIHLFVVKFIFNLFDLFICIVNRISFFMCMSIPVQSQQYNPKLTPSLYWNKYDFMLKTRTFMIVSKYNTLSVTRWNKLQYMYDCTPAKPKVHTNFIVSGLKNDSYSRKYCKKTFSLINHIL